MHEVEGYDGRLVVMDSPHVSSLVMTIRDANLQKSSYNVRQCVSEIGRLMAYDVECREASLGTFLLESVRVVTGNGGAIAEHPDIRTVEPVILNILRSADEMVHGARKVFREAPVIYADTKRVEGTYNPETGSIKIDIKYMSAPNSQPDGQPFSLTGRVLPVPDPMGATFRSAEAAVAHASQLYGRPSRHIFMNVITAKTGVEAFLERMQSKGIDCCVYTAVLDLKLDHRAFIVPGAGDLGDLQHNGGIPMYRILQQLLRGRKDPFEDAHLR